mmetsp:Transcript_1587/g.972  ORF Transcript_1587/g.972 Transcript_1587/m.972 type:complete len:116 (+) Transcript_1587:51-398(+)
MTSRMSHFLFTGTRSQDSLPGLPLSCWHSQRAPSSCWHSQQALTWICTFQWRISHYPAYLLAPSKSFFPWFRQVLHNRERNISSWVVLVLPFVFRSPPSPSVSSYPLPCDLQQQL